MSEHNQAVDECLAEAVLIHQAVRDQLARDISLVGDVMIDRLRHGGRILTFGNGGSAADAQHFAAELIGRFELDRAGLPALALSADTSSVTAVANDFGFAEVFARQVRALGRANDVAVAISTSGHSVNVVLGARAARETGMQTLGLTGSDGGSLAAECDMILRVPSQRAARVQEAHIVIIHALCELIDSAFGSL